SLLSISEDVAAAPHRRKRLSGAIVFSDPEPEPRRASFCKAQVALFFSRVACAFAVSTYSLAGLSPRMGMANYPLNLPTTTWRVS
ncbi:MAG TPA: hypothetical protein VNT26_21750, partial [Candidatus Sulfotelmatobacter sp.]|nr:hypothetical protein [Candidatus Sulfotelmatobacter sp.]